MNGFLQGLKMVGGGDCEGNKRDSVLKLLTQALNVTEALKGPLKIAGAQNVYPAHTQRLGPTCTQRTSSLRGTQKYLHDLKSPQRRLKLKTPRKTWENPFVVCLEHFAKASHLKKTGGNAGKLGIKFEENQQNLGKINKTWGNEGKNL